MSDSGVADTALISIVGEPIGRISPRLYGVLAEHLGRCCYDGLWVGPGAGAAQTDDFRTDVVTALRDLPLPLIRWPGGCYADRYHWRNGIGAAASRPGTLGMSCGLQAADTNALGTHEFLRLCEMIGAEPYLAGNVGTGTVQEMCDWIEYVNSGVDSDLTRERASNGRSAPWGVRLWGVGNESWDCGGRFDAESYAREYRRYAAMIRQVDPTVELVAVGLQDDPLPESGLDAGWNARFLAALGTGLDLVDHLSIHRYWITGGPETAFDADGYYALLAEADATEGLVERTARVVDAATAATGGRRGRTRPIGIALDEWGVWHPEAREWGPGDVARRSPVTFAQAGTMRDALAAAVALEGFHRQCNVLSMANLAQAVNVLQCLLTTDDGACVRTPTYHALALHRPHIGADALRVEVATDLTIPPGLPGLSATASRCDAGLAVTLTNRHLSRPVEVTIRVRATLRRARLLTGEPSAVNTPAAPELVAPRQLEITGLSDDGYAAVMPPHSISTIEFQVDPPDARHSAGRPAGLN
jgi:alpha-N-arabinofuranosidase